MADLFDSLIDNHETVLEQDDAVIGAAVKDLLRRRYIKGNGMMLIGFASYLIVKMAIKASADRIVFGIPVPGEDGDETGSEWKISVRQLTRRETARQSRSRKRVSEDADA